MRRVLVHQASHHRGNLSWNYGMIVQVRLNTQCRSKENLSGPEQERQQPSQKVGIRFFKNSSYFVKSANFRDVQPTRKKILNRLQNKALVDDLFFRKLTTASIKQASFLR